MYAYRLIPAFCVEGNTYHISHITSHITYHTSFTKLPPRFCLISDLLENAKHHLRFLKTCHAAGVSFVRPSLNSLRRYVTLWLPLVGCGLWVVVSISFKTAHTSTRPHISHVHSHHLCRSWPTGIQTSFHQSMSHGCGTSTG